MAEYKVKKRLKNKETGEMLNVGDVIDRKVKEIEEFEKKNGTDYLERIDNKDKE